MALAGARGNQQPPDTVSAEEHASSSGEEENAFDPKEFILGNIYDSYEWHIISFNHTHVTIPLPIILYSQHTGWHVFMSSKFDHGHSSYKGFKIAQKGPHEGDIVEILENGEQYEPLDLSITRVASGIFVSVFLMLFIFLPVAKRYKNNPLKPPTGMQALLEPVILFIRDDVARPIIGEDQYHKFMPYLLSLFFFILITNLLALVPLLGEGAATGNIAGTLALAIFTFCVTLIYGTKHYWKEIFNPDVPVFLKLPVPLLPIIEIISLIIRPFTLTIRLFANVSAGHIIKLGFVSLIFLFGQIQVAAGLGISPLSVVFVLFMMILDIFIAVIQAYIFTILSALYIGEAVGTNHE